MSTAGRIHRLVGVYDADGTVWGELTYWIGARLGRRHCSLCDITHGSIRIRPEWVERRADLPVEFVAFHRNDQPDSIRAVAAGRFPIVVAETDRGPVALLGPEELDACHGSVDRLLAAIDRAVAQLGFHWRPATPET